MYIIRKELLSGGDFLFFYRIPGKRGFSNEPTLFRSKKKAISEWNNCTDEFRAVHQTAYIVGPQAGHYNPVTGTHIKDDENSFMRCVATYWTPDRKLNRTGIDCYTRIWNSDWEGFMMFRVRAESGYGAKRIASGERFKHEKHKLELGTALPCPCSCCAGEREKDGR